MVEEAATHMQDVDVEYLPAPGHSEDPGPEVHVSCASRRHETVQERASLATRT